jgi:phosphoglucosamine mutase
VVIDCANGAAYKVAPTVLRELGADVIVLHNTPNGTNINMNCGAVYPADLQKAVLFHQADIGIAYDGDADRAVFVDEKGAVVPGEAVLAAFALNLYENKSLAGNALVTTEMSNTGMEKALRASGISVVRTAVGDRYVLEKMISGGYNLGGEPSGHMIFLDYNTSGDGPISALQLLSLMRQSRKPASTLTLATPLLPQVTMNIKVRTKKTLKEIPELQKAIAHYTSRMHGSGRLIVRYSGTENLLRIMVEGEDPAALSKTAEHLASIAEQQIGLVG